MVYIKRVLIPFVILFVSGLILFFLKIDNNFIGTIYPFLIYISVVWLIGFSALLHVSVKKSSKLLGIYILVFVIFFLFKYSTDFKNIVHINDIEKFRYLHHIYLIKLIIFLLVLVFLLYCSLTYTTTEKTFDNIMKTLKIKIIFFVVIILIFLESPIFGIHENKNKLFHGHSFWMQNHDQTPVLPKLELMNDSILKK
jgi:hypothetical protein